MHMIDLNAGGIFLLLGSFKDFFVQENTIVLLFWWCFLRLLLKVHFLKCLQFVQFSNLYVYCITL